MSLDSANVDVALTGTVSKAASGSTAPTNATDPLPPAYTDMGYLSADGVAEARDRSTNNITAWQNAKVVRVTVTESSATFQCVMIETKKITVETFYGSTMDNTGMIDVDPGETGGRAEWVIDYIDGDKYVRAWIPDGEIMTVGEVKLGSSDAVGMDVTITAYPSTRIGGNSFRKWYSALAA